jgi:fermentation-respiration switch protein FrsA (DUF1100 family)
MAKRKKVIQNLLFSALSLAVLWSSAIFGLGMRYVARLLHPACPDSGTTPAGFQSVDLETETGLQLKGWWRPPENGIVVLILGGLGASRDSMLPAASMLVENGFGALTLDYRHCAGEISTLGYQETEELEAMLAYVLNQPGTAHTAVLGFSVGGAAAVMGAARNPRIEAVIAEGNYAHLKDEITAVPSAPLSLQWQIQRAVLAAYWLRTGIPAADVSPIDAIPMIAPRPILFIHGQDEIGRTRGLQQFAAAENAELWVVPGAAHGEAIRIYPEEYENRIVSFLQTVFSGQ